MKYKGQRLPDDEQVILKLLVLEHFGRWGEEGWEFLQSLALRSRDGSVQRWLAQHCLVPRLLEKEIQRTIATVSRPRNQAQDVFVVLEDCLTYCCSS